MRPILSAREMKQIDADTIERCGIPSLELMERAARAVEAEILKRSSGAERVLVLCGTGNNGADGLALARMLTERRFPVRVLTVGSYARATTEWKVQYRHLLPGQEYHIETEEEANAGAVAQLLSQAQILVDAVFGIGLTREVAGVQAALTQCVCAALQKEKKPVFAVDMPSGIHTDTGRVMGCAIPADYTVTFGFVKRGQVFYPGADYCGALITADIGFASEKERSVQPECCALDETAFGWLPARRADSHKGSYGKLLTVAGAEGMAGAALFSAAAAYRTGCGLVCLATAKENRIIAQSGLAEAVFVPLEAAAAWTKEEVKRQRFTAAVIGPGLGTDALSKTALEHMLAVLAVPLLLDADALNLLAADPELARSVRRYAHPVVITPHLGELGRLLGQDAGTLKEDLVQAARRAAEKFDCICVAKDSRTVTASREGEIFLNMSGNNGMATGGSGDVLSGIIGGLLAQGMQPMRAAALGVYLHGLAGDEAASRRGKASVMARDILEGIAPVLMREESV